MFCVFVVTLQPNQALLTLAISWFLCTLCLLFNSVHSFSQCCVACDLIWKSEELIKCFHYNFITISKFKFKKPRSLFLFLILISPQSTCTIQLSNHRERLVAAQRWRRYATQQYAYHWTISSQIGIDKCMCCTRFFGLNKENEWSFS